MIASVRNLRLSPYRTYIGEYIEIFSGYFKTFSEVIFRSSPGFGRSSAVYLFHNGIIHTRQAARGEFFAQRLEGYYHIKPAIEKLPLREIHSGDLFMLISRPLRLLRVIGIPTALVAAYRLINIYGRGIVPEDRPKEMLIICPDLILRSEKSLRKTLLRVEYGLMAGDIPVAGEEVS